MIRNRKLLLILGVWLYVLKQSVDARPQLEAFDDESGELEDEYDDRVKRIIGLGNLGNAKNVYQKVCNIYQIIYCLPILANSYKVLLLVGDIRVMNHNSTTRLMMI